MSFSFIPNQNYNSNNNYRSNLYTQNNSAFYRTNQDVRTNEAVRYRELPFGRMIEYDPQGEVIYQGEMINYERNGNGIHYNGNYMYLGVFKNGLYHGEGMLMTRPAGKIIFSGKFYEGNRCGQFGF